MVRKIILLLLFPLVNIAQKTDSIPLIRDKSLIALPVVFRFPETGWGGGVAATSSWSWGKDSSWAKPSQASVGLTYTQNKQILAFLPFQVFFANNKYYLNADIGWFKYNFFYYGVGENRVPEERYDVRFPRVKILASRQLNENIYAGLRINFEAYDVFNQAEGGELANKTISGSHYSRTSALGPAFLIDTRDQVFYPTKGVFGEVSFLPSLKILGADRNFSQATLDISQYQSLGKRLVLASNFYNVFSFGNDVPFSQLAQLGGPKKMRGIYQGFFRDQNASLLQAELRWNVWKFIGLTGFGSMGFLGDNQSVLRLNLPKFTYGAGLRIATKNKLNLRLDYGLSPYGEGNFYATVGEAF
ncbi:BamA/TamA family outer membrane protein [Jiulongibacter sediminis]|uniref:BamA/TamA family outer membrane protein n=1 Tax=Jiulongibacter sediminis TaxID=1605367 RepID=UPI0026EB841F|nr:BamA/TamA family outer membrane protein [Jiulongibacter sediminis]